MPYPNNPYQPLDVVNDEESSLNAKRASGTAIMPYPNNPYQPLNVVNDEESSLNAKRASGTTLVGDAPRHYKDDSLTGAQFNVP